MTSKSALALEFVVIFLLLPACCLFLPARIPALPILWIATGYCCLVLRHDAAFNRKMLWNVKSFPDHLRGILLLFGLTVLIGTLLVFTFAHDLLFNLVRAHPVFWGFLMLAYPVLSVYPQGLIYRAFFMERYRTLFPSAWLLVLISATVFAYMHIVFRNPLAVGLTFLGGLVFAWRYARSESLLTSSIEHALYGWFLFTIGLGGYFFDGSLSFN